MREKISCCKGMWHVFCVPAAITITIAVLACFMCKPAEALDVELTLGTESAFNVVRGTSVSTGTTLFYVGTSTVGIGTTTPSAMFTIAGSSTSGADVSLSLVNTAGTSLLYAQNDGKVGIGTNTPSSALTVAGTTTVSGNLAVGTSTNTLFVDSTNNRVGIGTTTPSAALTVNGAFLRAGSTMIGPYSNTHINLGVDSTTGTTSSNVQNATVGGGYQNTASGGQVTVGGGELNTASAYHTTIGGGYSNTASSSYATVGGGYFNTASNSYATVGGGASNTASGAQATVGGGELNTASGMYSTVGGGWRNVAAGDYSWAGGRYMQLSANADRTFAFGYSTTAVSIDTADAFLIFPNYTGATGKVGIGTSTPTRKLSVNGDAGGTSAWNTDSDERLKKNIMPIERALEKVTGLQGVHFEWIDTTNHEEGRRIGFVAQQVKDVLPEVVDKKGGYYSMQYAPITALLVEAIKEMKAENDALKARISALEQCRVGIAHQ